MAGLREILVSFGIDFDTAPLDKGNAKVESGLASLKAFGAALAGAFAVSKIVGFVNEQVKLGDQLGDQAVLLDMSTKSLEQWQYAAQFAEISGEELQGMFMRLARSANSAQDAGSAQGKALKKLGIDVKNYTSTADVFEVVGTKLAGMKEGYERTALAAQFFGKAGGAKVLQLFKDGADGISKYREEFELLGGGMGDFAKQAGEVDDAEKRLNFAWGVTKTRIAGVFLPALEWGIGKLTKFAAAATKLIDGTHILGVALGVLGALAVASAIKIVAAYLPVIAPFLLWAAAIAAVILIAEDLFAFFEGRRSLVGRVIDNLFGPGSSDKVRTWCKSVWALIMDVGSQIKAIFGDSTLSIQERFQKFIEWLGSTFREKAKEIFGDVGGDVVTEITGAVAEVIGLFEGTAETIIAIFKGVGEAIAKAIALADDFLENQDAKSDAADRSRDANAGAGKPKSFYDTVRDVIAPSPATIKGRLAAAQGIPIPAGGGGPPPVVNNITVPPGTPATLAARVGTAAHQGTAAALAAPNRAAAAGLGRTAPKK